MSIGVIASHGVISSGVTGYAAAVLADSPSFYYPAHSVASNVWPDASGNSRSLDTLSGTPPTLDATGGPDLLGAMVFGASAGHLHTSFAAAPPAVGTYEAWIYAAALPAAEVGILAQSPNTGSDGTLTLMRLRADGKISNYITPEDVVTTSAITTGAWHHVVASWGTAGHKIRVDKVTTGTGTQTSSPTTVTTALRVHGFYFPSSNLSETGAIKFAHLAFYPTQLSDTRTDAHFDAM